MRKLNHYQTDILFVILVIVFQWIFTYFYPFRNPEAETDIAVNQRFIFLEFEFVDLNTTTLYVPIVAIIYAVLLLVLILQKKRRLALIYGFGIALVAKVSFLTDLYALSGQTYTDLSVSGFLSQRIVDNDTVLAQNITFYVLLVLLVIKIGIYVHDTVIRMRLKQNSNNNT